MSLTFAEMRTANVTRCETAFHPVADWSPTDWATAMAGECGEACNVVKKIRRLETAPHWAPGDANYNLVEMTADELADLVIYADLLAARLGIDLGGAIVRKFNDVSEKVGSDVRLPEDDVARRTVDSHAVRNALLLTDCEDVDDATVAAWTDDERAAAFQWAAREHLHANDNDDVERLPCPAHVEPLRRVWGEKGPASS